MTSNIPSMPELDTKKESSSLFKENQRLRAENARLQESLNKMQEELQSRDVLAKTLTSFDNEKYDARRLAMYRAKALKQERMVFSN
jgi:regulator of replication initiation timing